MQPAPGITLSNHLIPESLRAQNETIDDLHARGAAAREKVEVKVRALNEAKVLDARELQDKVRAGVDLSKLTTDKHEAAAMAELRKAERERDAIFSVLRQEENTFDRALNGLASEIRQIAERRAQEVGGKFAELANALIAAEPEYLDSIEDWYNAILYENRAAHLASGRGPASWRQPPRNSDFFLPPERGTIAVGRLRESHIETAKLAAILRAHTSRHLPPAEPVAPYVQSNPFPGRMGKPADGQELDTIFDPVSGEVRVLS